jgi:hypothetical protein
MFGDIRRQVIYLYVCGNARVFRCGLLDIDVYHFTYKSLIFMEINPKSTSYPPEPIPPLSSPWAATERRHGGHMPHAPRHPSVGSWRLGAVLGAVAFSAGARAGARAGTQTEVEYMFTDGRRR